MQEATRSVEQSLSNQMTSQQLDRLYNSLAYAETGSQSNPWIRTTVQPKGGSTAYGPLQITGSLVRGHLAPGNVERYNPDEVAFMQRMDAQAKQFAKWGGTKKNPTYEYGGPGDLVQSDTDKAMYAQVAKKMLGYELEKSGGDTLGAVERWRGVKRHQDPGYFQKVMAHYNSS